jgi:hypothetical protein
MKALHRAADTAMALCLAVMALAVFINVVLRYGFGSGIAVSEELSRLLFVWLVFIGAAAAYPRGEHMAFTSLWSVRTGHRAARAGAAGLRLVGLGCVAAGGGGFGQPLGGDGLPERTAAFAGVVVRDVHRRVCSHRAVQQRAAAVTPRWRHRMSSEATAFVVFIVGLLGLMGLGLNMGSWPCPFSCWPVS